MNDMIVDKDNQPNVSSSANPIGGYKSSASPTLPNPAHRSANFLSQLDAMMGAVKKEANALEGMKLKLKEMEDFRGKYSDLKSKLVEVENEREDLRVNLNEMEIINRELRDDMQRLNDMYTSERAKHIEIQQITMKYEQDLSVLRHEKEFFLKESSKMLEMRKTNKSLNNQIKHAQELFEEERNNLQKKLSDSEKTVAGLEQQHKETSHQLWQATDENKRLQHELDKEEIIQINLQKDLNESKRVVHLNRDRLGMMSEDFTQRRVEIMKSRDKYKKEVYRLNIELSNQNLTTSELQKKLEMIQHHQHELEETSKSETAGQQNKVVTLQDTIKELTSKNKQSVKDITELNNQIHKLGEENSKHEEEIFHLKNILYEKETHWSIQMMEETKKYQLLLHQKEDNLIQLQQVMAQYEALQLQQKNENTKNWEEIENLKDNENQLLEETEKLSQELSETLKKCHQNEIENKNLNENLNKISNVNENLQVELEKRLDELMKLRKEKENLYDDYLQEVKEKEEMKREMKGKEMDWLKKLSLEKEKMKTELTRQWNVRWKSCEKEKKECLDEINELRKMMEDMTKEKNLIIQEKKEEKLKNIEEMTKWKDKQDETVYELKKNLDVEIQLKNELIQKEKKSIELIKSLENQMQEIKKIGHVEIVSMHQQVQNLLDDLEKSKKNQEILENENNKLKLENKKMNQELEMNQLQHGNSIDMQNKEVNKLRQELNDYRTKSKLWNETRNKLDKEIMNQHHETLQLENEIKKLHEMKQSFELLNVNNMEKLKSSQQTIELLQDSNKQMKMKGLELEDLIQKKNTMIDHLQREMDEIEREGGNEVRRLRLQLTSVENELIECHQTTIPMLQKELNDMKANFMKLQSNTNHNVENLLQELKTTEDALSKERKTSQQRTDEYHLKLSESQSNVERLRELIDENESKYKADRMDRENRGMLIETELDRYKQLIIKKDERLDELEQQRQGDRIRLQEIRGKNEELEREVIDLKSSNEMELLQRKRLESKLKALEASSSLGGGGGGSMMDLDGEGNSSSSGAGGGGLYGNGSSGGMYSSRSNLSSRAAAAAAAAVIGLDGGGGGLMEDRMIHQNPSASRDRYRQETTDSSYFHASNSNHLSSRHAMNYEDVSTRGGGLPDNSMDHLLMINPQTAATGGSSYRMDSPPRSIDLLSDPVTVHPIGLNPSNRSFQYLSAVDRVSATLAMKATHEPRTTGNDPTSFDRIEGGGGSDVNLTSTVEETIARTQRALNQRLLQPQPHPSHSSDLSSRSIGGIMHPSSSKVVENINESIHHAHILYPNQPDESMSPNRRPSSATTFQVTVPTLQPVLPPKLMIPFSSSPSMAPFSNTQGLNSVTGPEDYMEGLSMELEGGGSNITMDMDESEYFGEVDDNGLVSSSSTNNMVKQTKKVRLKSGNGSKKKKNGVKKSLQEQAMEAANAVQLPKLGSFSNGNNSFPVMLATPVGNASKKGK